MRYFLSAVAEDSADALAAQIEADTFEDAFSELRRLAMARWPGQYWRPTCIVEEPARGPVGLVFDLSRARPNDTGIPLSRTPPPRRTAA
jgi:hypothetical protein